MDQATPASLLADAGDREIVPALLELFFRQTEKDAIYRTALAIEGLSDRRAVAPLIKALIEDRNPHRRRAAARALGWMSRPGRAAALALGQCLADPSQPQEAREEAAESLAYVGNRETIEPLTAALRDPDVRIRFWAVFGLGGRHLGDSRVIRALESVLDDDEIPPGNWWSVGREALAMLAHNRHYKPRIKRELEQILADPNATAEDRRWARSYDYLT